MGEKKKINIYRREREREREGEEREREREEREREREREREITFVIDLLVRSLIFGLSTKNAKGPIIDGFILQRKKSCMLRNYYEEEEERKPRNLRFFVAIENATKVARLECFHFLLFLLFRPINIKMRPWFFYWVNLRLGSIGQVHRKEKGLFLWPTPKSSDRLGVEFSQLVYSEEGKKCVEAG